MELEDRREFDNDFDEEDLDRNVLEWMESAFFDLLLWEYLELHDLGFVFSPFAPIFRLYGLSGAEPLVLCRGLVLLLSKPKRTLDTISDAFLI